MSPSWRSTERRWVAACGLLIGLTGATGCASFSERTVHVRAALDVGDPRAAIVELDREMKVDHETDLPKDMAGDEALLVLDRATIQQALSQFALSEVDFQAADKAIDMLDLAHNAGDSIGEYVFSGSSGKYVAPPYEKLMLNTLNMLNYLESGDVAGAQVEARRMSVIQRYLKDELHEDQNPILGLGGLLAGLAFEKGGGTDEALRYYDEALRFRRYNGLIEPLRRLAAGSSYSSPRLKEMIGEGAPPPDLEKSNEGEIIVVVGYGRVPHKIPERVPIGLALTLLSNDLSPGDRAAANRLAVQGLVTWINYPTLGPERGGYAIPSFAIDSRPAALEEAVDVTESVRTEWKKIEGKIMLSAVTRLIARFAAGQGIQAAAGRNSIAGALLSLGTQATLTALDKPDTRSWETLPARVAFGRIRVPAGRHTVRLEARGAVRQGEVEVRPGGWVMVSLQSLR
jgi:hypothetical protein